MATKNQSPAVQPDDTVSLELFEITELRDKQKVSRAIFDGVCADNGWKPGKKISAAEFAQAVASFTGMPMSGRSPTESGVR